MQQEYNMTLSMLQNLCFSSSHDADLNWKQKQLSTQQISPRVRAFMSHKSKDHDYTQWFDPCQTDF